MPRPAAEDEETEIASRLPWAAPAARVPVDSVRQPKPGVERRHPERHRHTMALLRTIAALCLIAVVGLLAVPPLLARFGLIGPTTEEIVAGAAQAVEAARHYGARPDLSPFAQATEELEAARRLAAEGRDREARDTAARVSEKAIEAQKLAIARGQDDRHRARLIVEDLDRRVEELEDLYAQVTPGLPKDDVSQLFSLMKNARETAAGLTLAFQDGQYEKVTGEGEAAARVLDSIRTSIVAARR